MGKKLKKHAKVFMSAILSLLMVLSVIQISTVSLKAEGEDAIASQDDIANLQYQVGDIIKFGKYEQDGNLENGKEDIEWQVLKVEDNRILVVSRYGLESNAYNTESAEVTWETCTLRKWLNNDFINTAFNSNEKDRIPTVTLENKDNPKWGTPGGNNTNDKVFCLSLEEMETYFGNYSWYDNDEMYGFNQNLICTPTQYAINNGASYYDITEDDYNSWLINMGYTKDVIGRRGCFWWLRSPGSSLDGACDVYTVGFAGPGHGSGVAYKTLVVRPALYLLNETIYPSSITLDKTNATMYFGEELTLNATLKPDNVTEKEIKWTVSNPSIASVNNGKVKAWGAGEIKVTAETVNGLKATCDITILCENNPENPFADVKSGNWKYDAAIYVYEKGYMTGKGIVAGKVLFSPDANITRAEFVQILYSAEGKPDVEYSNRFSDVPEGAWFAKAVLWAEKNGIVAGTGDGIFDVNGNATREQMALMFYKYAIFKGYDVSVKEGGKTLSDFTDANKVSSWAKNAIEWAVSRGIISGKGSAETGYKIDPQGKATRVETAAILRTFINSYAETGSNMINEEFIFDDGIDNDAEDTNDFSEENKMNVCN